MSNDGRQYDLAQAAAESHDAPEKSDQDDLDEDPDAHCSPELLAHHVARVNRALLWLYGQLPDARTGVVNPEDGLLSVEWRGWTIEIDPYNCLEPGDTTLTATIRRGETIHYKSYGNYNHMVNSVIKIAREDP